MSFGDIKPNPVSKLMVSKIDAHIGYQYNTRVHKCEVLGFVRIGSPFLGEHTSAKSVQRAVSMSQLTDLVNKWT
jgi:hypothetical protein